VQEGDTVWLSAERLRTALVGKVLSRSDFRVPQLATVDLRGRGVLGVEPRGKHLLTRIEGGLTLHTHFRMDGSFRLYHAGARWTGGPSAQIRLVLGNDERTAVGYRIPVIELIDTVRESEVVGHLGPDVLGAWDADRAVENLRRNGGAEIGSALLDQRNLAGLGNLYRTEALFLRGISPWTPVRDIADLPNLVDLGARLIQANRHHWTQSTTGNARRDESHYVFERQGLPCRRCRTTIRTARQGLPPTDRITYWCPSCQPGPSPEGSDRRPRFTPNTARRSTSRAAR
jgi:endonuclease VIII